VYLLTSVAFVCTHFTPNTEKQLVLPLYPNRRTYPYSGGGGGGGGGTSEYENKICPILSKDNVYTVHERSQSDGSK